MWLKNETKQNLKNQQKKPNEPTRLTKPTVIKT